MTDIYADAQGQIGGAASQGQGAINSFNPTDVAGRQMNQFSQLKSSQLGAGPQNAADYMGAYSQAVAANPTVTNLYNTANKMFDVPQLAGQAAYLQNQVTNVAPNQYAIARGFDISEPQVENAINTNLRFLQPQATAATNQAQTAQNLAGQYVQAGQAQNAQNLLPIQSYQPLLQQALAAQATGFTQAAQQEFAGLQAKMEAGVQLSQTEMQTYQQLAQTKMNYDATLAGYQNQLQQRQLANQYQTLSPAQTLVNTFTGGLYRAA